MEIACDTLYTYIRSSIYAPRPSVLARALASVSFVGRKILQAVSSRRFFFVFVFVFFFRKRSLEFFRFANRRPFLFRPILLSRAHSTLLPRPLSRSKDFAPDTLARVRVHRRYRRPYTIREATRLPTTRRLYAFRRKRRSSNSCRASSVINRTLFALW